MSSGWKSSFKGVFLTLIAVFLTFAGPTYVILLLEKLGAAHPFLTFLGFILFLAGLVLILFLVSEED